jgi:small subunit ribosomal protein S1
MKQLEQNPWSLLERRYPPGTRIVGKIRNITDFGIFIGIEDGIDGLVHISDMSWTQKIKHPSEVYKKGDEVEAVVLNIDAENERFSLGIKQLTEDPWLTLPDRMPPGHVTKAIVTKITDFGAFAEVEDGIEGLVHISELSTSHVEKPEDVVKMGQEVRVEVISVDPRERKIALSIKSYQQREESGTLREYRDDTNQTTMGELLSQRRDRE